MANEQNLRPIQSTARARELGSKGGKIVTERQRIAQRWRYYKKKLKLGKIESDNPKWLVERVENDKSFALDMLRDIDELEKEEYPLDKLVFLKNLIYKSLHGKAQQVNIQTNQQNELANVQINFITYDKNKLYSVSETEESP